MFGYHTVLHAEHVESEGLMMLTVTPGPRLAHVNDNHVVIANHIQQFALVIPREFVSGPRSRAWMGEREIRL